jgi:hypothetical protein
MGTLDSVITGLFGLFRVYMVGLSLSPTLFGLLMVLWGIFLNDWDWTLITVGLLIFLFFGWNSYKCITWDPTEET